MKYFKTFLTLAPTPGSTVLNFEGKLTSKMILLTPKILEVMSILYFTLFSMLAPPPFPEVSIQNYDLCPFGKKVRAKC